MLLRRDFPGRETLLRVLHIASFDRWTGAAAPAFAETEALRLSGVDAHYAFVGGNNLERKLERHDFAHPVIERHSAFSVPRSILALRRLVAQTRPQVLHAHLSHDHILALLSAPSGTPLVRTYHAVRALRRDPGSRLLARRTDAIAVVSEALREHPLLAGREVAITPPPLDTRHFTPEGANARERLGVARHTPLVGYIGKVAPGRGFEEAIDTFAAIRRELPDAKMMIIGRGPHRPPLEARIAQHSLVSDVIWAGYHEGDDLADHYRAADVMLFTAPGSDHGHRAILEEIGCGAPVVAYPIPGVVSLLGPHGDRLISRTGSPRELAELAVSILRTRDHELRHALVKHSRNFNFATSAERLIRLYSGVIAARS